MDALFQQTGVIRDTFAELFDAAPRLGSQPVPPGNRVAILTNAGGPAILCADACEANGLVVPALPQEVRDVLAGFLPAAASTGNAELLENHHNFWCDGTTMAEGDPPRMLERGEKVYLPPALVFGGDSPDVIRANPARRRDLSAIPSAAERVHVHPVNASRRAHGRRGRAALSLS